MMDSPAMPSSDGKVENIDDVRDIVNYTADKIRGMELNRKEAIAEIIAKLGKLIGAEKAEKEEVDKDEPDREKPGKATAVDEE